MALRLTPLMGTTAFPDRMGDYYPELLEAGRIVQGYDVSGAMSSEMIAAVNRDFADAVWRSVFHEVLLNDYRFQRGLFDVSQFSKARGTGSEGQSVLSEFTQHSWVDQPYSVDRVRALSRTAFSLEDGPSYEYGWALIKTATALVYTIRLCHRFELAAVTDSASHFLLLTHTCKRDNLELINACVPRDGY